jgi:protein-S-isoprenylcysteine O-methyltransferase Ste14
MEFKGMDKLREKLPDYPGKRIYFFPLVGILAALLGYVFLIMLDLMPRLLSSVELLVTIEPFIPVLGTLLLGSFGFWMIGLLWSRRDSMKEKYGNLAYQHMIKYGATGVFMVPPLVFHAFTSIRSLPGSAVNPLTTQWAMPILQLLGIPADIDVWSRMIISGILIIFGALTVRSALLTFGLDYMTVVYLYYPEESEIVDHEIYSIVRHPTYLGGSLLAIAAIAFRFSVYSIVIGIIAFLIFRLQVRREDKELVNRFGDSYRTYMKKVPALHVRFRDIGTYLRFLRIRSSS